jgi:hypothetical protein
MAAACRENRERVQTLHFSGTVTLTGRQFEDQRDPVAGKTYESQTREFSVWKDAVNLRWDETSNREVDGGTGEVLYNVPYGEHFCDATEADRQALQRKFGTTQSTRRNLITADEGYLYQPESNALFFGQRNRGGVEEQQEVAFALNRTFMGGTLDQFVDRWAELAKRRDQSQEVTHLEPGQYLLRTAVNVALPGEQPYTSTLQAVVDLDKGGNVMSYVVNDGGQVRSTGQFEYMNVDGTWVVAHAEVAEMIGPDGVPMTNAVYEIRPEGVQINAPIDPRIFTFEGLEVRRGALVVNQKTGENYLYDEDMTIEQKAALWVAREREKRAEAGTRAPQDSSPPPVQQPSKELRQSQAPLPPGGGPAPEPHATSAPGLVAVEPIPRGGMPARTVQTDTLPAQVCSEPNFAPGVPATSQTVLTPATSQKLVAAQPASSQRAERGAPGPPATGGWMPPTTVVTALVIGAGCVAALGIVLRKKLASRAAGRRG